MHSSKPPYNQIEYRDFDEKDLNHISQLLKDNKLPVSDLSELKIDFIVATDQGEIVGCIGLERHGTDGLLRSFAVKDGYKSQGIGGRLIALLFAKCTVTDIKTLHLLTTTAELYFLKKGFRKGDRSMAPPVIQATQEFSGICPVSATYMQIDIKTGNSAPIPEKG